eukprot:gene5330-7396_t
MKHFGLDSTRGAKILQVASNALDKSTSNLITATSFLTPLECLAVEETFRHSTVKCTLIGGFAYSIRKRALFTASSNSNGIELLSSIGSYNVMSEEDHEINNYISVLNINGDFQGNYPSSTEFSSFLLQHNLIDINEIGDIVSNGSYGAQVLLTPEALNSLMNSNYRFSCIGSVMVNLEPMKLDKLDVNRLPKDKEMNSIEHSLRLDSIASAGFGSSRTVMTDLIGKNNVYVNWKPTKSVSYNVQVGQVISVNNLGLLYIDDIIPTNKGKHKVAMDVQTLENIVLASVSSSGTQRNEAGLYLDQVRLRNDRWQLGLNLFFNSQSEVTQFFGLSLVREYMSCNNPVPSPEVRTSVRESILNWVNSVIHQKLQWPGYIVNNIASIIALCLKWDYPENWSNAFNTVLGFGKSIEGVDLVVRVLNDLEVEVVMFNDDRTKEEIAHNVLVKDTLRSSSDLTDIVLFLCSWATSLSVSPTVQSSVELSGRCLLCLSELVGWIDINLIIMHALPTIYKHIPVSLLENGTAVVNIVSSNVSIAALKSLYELVKKGMDPIVKVTLVNSINLFQTLSSNSSYVINILKELQMKNDDSTELCGFDLMNCNGVVKQLGLVLDMLVLELLGCWSKYEDHLILSVDSDLRSSITSTDRTSFEELIKTAPLIHNLLRDSLPILLELFSCPLDIDVSSSVFPAINKLISTIKQQSQLTNIIKEQQLSGNIFFNAVDYLDPVLMGIYNQLKYPEDFTFDESNDEEMEIIEMKSNVRKLFVNCCRVYPQRCLDLITAIFESLPQPLSQAPYPMLEAALRLVYAFSECGPSHNTLIASGTFPALIQAIHQTDVINHSHPQVALVYFEISFRYIKLVDVSVIQRIASSLVNDRGLTNPDRMIRAKASYFLLKIMESMEGGKTSYQCLDIIGNSLKDIIMSSHYLPESAHTNNPYFTESSIIYIFECIGLMCSSLIHQARSANDNNDNNNNNNNIIQFPILIEIIGAISNQCNLILADIEQNQKVLLKMDISSEVNMMNILLISLYSISRGFAYKVDKHYSPVSIFQSASLDVVQILRLLHEQSSIRAKSIIFFHRMIQSIGESSLPFIQQVIIPLVQCCDTITELDLKGVEANGINIIIDHSSNISIRKSALVAINGLCKAWFVEIMNNIPLVTAFQSYIFDQVLPCLLFILMNKSQLNIKDPAALSVVLEIGVLIWTIFMVNNK